MPTAAPLTAPARRAAGRLAVAATPLALVLLNPVAALAAPAGKGEDTPLALGGEESGQHVGAGGGGSIARVLVGLLVVVGVIYGVTWILKQARRRGGDRPADATGSGLEPVTAMPLQGGGTLHLVRAGDELLLLGGGANGATVLRRYTEDEARSVGLWPEDEDTTPVDGPPSRGTRSFAFLGRNRTFAVATPAADRPTPAAATGGSATAATPGGRLVERLRAMTVRG